MNRGEREMRLSVIPAAMPEALVGALAGVIRASSADLRPTAAPSAATYTGLVSNDVIIAKVDAETPAAQVGLLTGDRLLSVAQVSGTAGEAVKELQRRQIDVWAIDLGSFAAGRSTDGLEIEFQRGGEVRSRRFSMAAREHVDALKNRTTRYVFGAFNDRELMQSYTFERDVGAVEALGRAVRQVGFDATLIGKGIVKMIQGVLPMESMGGPIMLFVLAGKSAEAGLDAFLRTLAVISVNLGLLNLLPIPVLDGGHLAIFAIEGIRRRPPSMRFREVTNMIGVTILLLLMVWVFGNDIVRFVLQ